MSLRELLNVSYVAIAQSSDDVDALDRELEAEPRPAGDVQPRTRGDLAAAMRAMRLPQQGGSR